MSDDIFQSIAEEADNVKNIPDDNSISKLRDMAQEFVDAENNVKDLEKQLKAAKEKRLQIARHDLPDFMVEMDTDSIGVSGVDVVLADFAHANISSDWEKEKRDKAFEHLVDIGGGDLIKATLTIKAGKEQLESIMLLRNLIELILKAPNTKDQYERIEIINDWLAEYGYSMEPIQASINSDLAVAWNTLTSFVKEQVEKGTVMDLDLLGANVGKIVKIKQRKN